MIRNRRTVLAKAPRLAPNLSGASNELHMQFSSKDVSDKLPYPIGSSVRIRDDTKFLVHNRTGEVLPEGKVTATNFWLSKDEIKVKVSVRFVFSCGLILYRQYEPSELSQA